jgi:multicomponent K+:H+ antiporter subunit E
MRSAPGRRPRRWLPSPVMSCTLALLWPVMNQSFSIGQILLGLLLAWFLPWWLQGLTTEQPRIRKPGTIVRLGLVVLKDIITSNIDVAKLILGPEHRIRPKFVWVPLRIQDPHGIVALAGIITMTPGTLSADVSDDRRHLLVHAFNVDDEAGLIASIQERYERPLMEIFT